MGFNKDDAEAIAKKLQATLVPGRKHDHAQFWHNGRLIGSYGIRRGSQRDLSHDYIPAQLHITPYQCKAFRGCTLTLQDLVALLQAKGLMSP